MHRLEVLLLAFEEALGFRVEWVAASANDLPAK